MLSALFAREVVNLPLFYDVRTASLSTTAAPRHVSIAGVVASTLIVTDSTYLLV